MSTHKRKDFVNALEKGQAKRIKVKSPSTGERRIVAEKVQVFARGGGSVLTPLETKQIQIKANEDALFEQRTGGKADYLFTAAGKDRTEDFLFHSTKSSASKDAREKKADYKVGLGQKKSHRPASLSYRSLTQGSIALGQVFQINKYDVAISLPNNLTGYIPLSSVSRIVTERVVHMTEETSADDAEDDKDLSQEIELSHYFTVGQFLRVHVSSVKETKTVDGHTRKHIEVSTEPQLVNQSLQFDQLAVNSTIQAEVLSVEDHGVVVDLGHKVGDMRGFISSKEIGNWKSLNEIHPGTVILCLVIGINSNGKIVKLSADPHRIGNLKKSNYIVDAPTVGSFLPGTAIEFTLSENSSSGIIGEAMGIVRVSADSIHSGALSANGPSLERRKLGSKLKGRIIYALNSEDNETIGISMLEHVLEFKPLGYSHQGVGLLPSERLPISTIIETATVVAVASGVGLLLEVGLEGVRAFAHISRLSDEKVKSISGTEGLYTIGSTHRCRIIGYNLMDGLFIASLEQSILDLPYLRLEDISVGQILKCSVERLVMKAKVPIGVTMKITPSISGFVPEIHFADMRLQYPERKFKENAVFTARVLSIDLHKRRMRLTLKKTLVNSEAPVWKTYADVIVGTQAPATIVDLRENGALVQFYGPVRGFLPVSQMSESYIEDPKQHFQIGQVVNVYATSVDPDSRRLIISCNRSDVLSPMQLREIEKLLVGDIVHAIVKGKTNKEITVELAISALKAAIDIGHLADDSFEGCLEAVKKVKIGQELRNLVVIGKNVSKRLIKLSGKPSLTSSFKAGLVPLAFEALTPGAKAVGWIRHITSTGVFVSFSEHLVGLLRKDHLPDSTQELADFGLHNLQVISVKVLSVDPNRRRFLLTQKAELPEVGEPDLGQSKPRTLRELGNKSEPSKSGYAIGEATRVAIRTVKDTQLNVVLEDGAQGRIDVSEVFNSWEQIKDRKRPLKQFSVHQTLSARIIGFHDSRNHRFLPISHTGKAPVLELSAKTLTVSKRGTKTLTMSEIEPGSSWLCFVNNIAEDCLWVNLSPSVRGRIRDLDISDDLSLLSDISKNFPLGSCIRAKAMSIDVENNHLDLCARAVPSPASIEELSQGAILPGKVTKIASTFIMVKLSDTVAAPVHLVDLADDYSKADPHNYSKNQIILACVKSIDDQKRITLSTRPSRVLSSAVSIVDPEVTSFSALKVNDVLGGFVKNITERGIFVSLGSSIDGFVRISHLSDSYIKDWRAQFTIGGRVRGRVIAIDNSLQHVELSLKSSIVQTDYRAPLTYADLSVGQLVSGRVRKVEEFGVFIAIDDSANVSGLCHRSEMSTEPIKDVSKLYHVGDAVRAMILTVDLERRRVSLGMKDIHLAALGQDAHSEDAPSQSCINHEDEDRRSLTRASSVSDEPLAGDRQIDLHLGLADDPSEPPNMSSLGDQTVSAGGFDWTGDSVPARRDQEIDNELGHSEIPSRIGRERRGLPTLDKTGTLDREGPQSVVDFERLLMGQPNSSYIWLSYAAFKLQINELVQAREIMERAVKTINHQSLDFEGEVLNVWVAYLNLENTYGNEESLAEIFKRACEHNDSLEVHNRLISVYIQSKKYSEADSLLEQTVRKFSQEPKVWLNFATFLMDTMAAPQRARDLLPRALQALPKSYQLDVSLKFAQLEFRSTQGDIERGRTLFEGLVSTFPRRLDVWGVWIDLEIKAAEKEQVRRLFQRVTSEKIKVKKAKYFFKRWLSFEESEGNTANCDRVKAKATAYVRKENDVSQ